MAHPRLRRRPRTDFAVYLDNLPINFPTHAHGQSYADINFIIPETLERFQLYKGPYFTQFGDFANAGALNFVTKEEFKENFAFAEGGSFETQRYVVGASPKLSWAKTLLAAQVYSTNGPFVDPQHYWRYNVFGKMTLDLTPESKLWFDGSVYDGDWDGSGQIPLRVVQEEHRLARGAVRRPVMCPRRSRHSRFRVRPEITIEAGFGAVECGGRRHPLHLGQSVLGPWWGRGVFLMPLR